MGNLLLGYPPNTAKTDDVVWNVHAQVDWDFGFAKLTYIPAFVRCALETSGDRGRVMI
jgi:hypothetical protein